MQYVRGRPDARVSEVRTSTFTGRSLMDPVLGNDDVTINNVFFEPGGRTYWHSHEHGQVIVIKEGKGLVATRAGEAQAVGAGDVVWAPAGEEHWHGAGPETLILHTAISLGVAEWLEEVSDADYRTAVARAEE